jgi:hypothetical protein
MSLGLVGVAEDVWKGGVVEAARRIGHRLTLHRPVRLEHAALHDGHIPSKSYQHD